MSRFVLLSGVLAYGLPMFVIMTFLIPHPKFTKPESAILWLLTGAGYGIAMWLMQEYRYRKAKPNSYREFGEARNQGAGQVISLDHHA